MTRPDQRIVATARLVENLAELMPQVRHHALLELTHLDGSADHTIGASNPDEHPKRRSIHPDATCRHNVPNPHQPDEMIDCGRPRPCGEHDTPERLTVVERNVEQRLKVERWLADIEQQCKLLAATVHDALGSGRRFIGTRVAVERPRCDSTGRDGSIEWADPTCANVPTRGPLCDRCSMREWRWRKARGLPPRTNGVFGQPARNV